jgi:hypothetical protein
LACSGQEDIPALDEVLTREGHRVTADGAANGFRRKKVDL